MGEHNKKVRLKTISELEKKVNKKKAVVKSAATKRTVNKSEK